MLNNYELNGRTHTDYSLTAYLILQVGLLVLPYVYPLVYPMPWYVMLAPTIILFVGSALVVVLVFGMFLWAWWGSR